ncbi:MAG: FkbM family methyltransferase [Planctomycetales bacterium]|nr:FkbM family methyltransferase [Planctomycetales bacterium]
MNLPVPDQRGFAKQLKRFVPGSWFRRLTTTYNAMLARVPYGLKYPVAGIVRHGRAPYCFLEVGDVVVQVGAPRDILAAGRSRAVHFARLVGRGRVLVVEPDAENCAALRRFVADVGLQDRIRLFECGAWHTSTTLTFLTSDDHPAANVLDGVQQISSAEAQQRGYRKVEVPVRSLDDMLDEAGFGCPKLVSVTTNGAEMQIVAGMRNTIAAGCPYISLASTGEGYIEQMQRYGYEYIVRDDRGYCFRQLALVAPSEPQPALVPSG